MCTIGHLVSQDRIYNQSQIPKGILRTSWRQAKREDNPLVSRGTKFNLLAPQFRVIETIVHGNDHTGGFREYLFACLSNVSFGVVRAQLRHTVTGKGTRLGTK